MYIKLEKKEQIMFALFKELNFIKPLSTLYKQLFLSISNLFQTKVHEKLVEFF